MCVLSFGPSCKTQAHQSSKQRDNTNVHRPQEASAEHVCRLAAQRQATLKALHLVADEITELTSRRNLQHVEQNVGHHGGQTPKTPSERRTTQPWTQTHTHYEVALKAMQLLIWALNIQLSRLTFIYTTGHRHTHKRAMKNNITLA